MRDAAWKTVLPRPQRPPRRRSLDGPADVAPEVVEVVLRLRVVLVAVVADIAREPPGAEVLDDQEVHGPPVVDPLGEPAALRVEMLAQPVQVVRGGVRAEPLVRRREGDDDSHRLTGQARIKRVLDGLPDHRVGETPQDLGGEELPLDGVHVDLAARHGAEFPEGLLHDAGPGRFRLMRDGGNVPGSDGYLLGRTGGNVKRRRPERDGVRSCISTSSLS